MTEMIYPIQPTDLQKDRLHQRIYPDLRQTLYWSDDWDPNFYMALARAGFISISQPNPEHGILLLPELQTRYAVLDWANLHISRQMRKLIRSGRIEEEEIELRVVEDHERVLERVLDYHGRRTSWLTGPYRKLLRRLPTGEHDGFALHGVELWSNERDLLIAGEFGYTLGQTYTSLSGFCTRSDPEWNGFGTLQMVLLAQRLESRGFAFWNMGHPNPPYKRALGARLLKRETFLRRWLEAREAPPERPFV